MAPTATISLVLDVCSCGQQGLVALSPSHTQQVLALPVVRPEVPHGLLHQGQGPSCGTLGNASLPAEQGSGYGPRLPAFMGEMAGSVGARRSAGQALGASGGGIPLSQGAIQTRGARVSTAIGPYDDPLGQGARSAAVHASDATSWLVPGDRPGLWGMANPEGAYCQIHPTRSQAACGPLMAAWPGIVVSDGALV